MAGAFEFSGNRVKIDGASQVRAFGGEGSKPVRFGDKVDAFFKIGAGMLGIGRKNDLLLGHFPEAYKRKNRITDGNGAQSI